MSSLHAASVMYNGDMMSCDLMGSLEMYMVMMGVSLPLSRSCI